MIGFSVMPLICAKFFAGLPGLPRGSAWGLSRLSSLGVIIKVGRVCVERIHVGGGHALLFNTLDFPCHSKEILVSNCDDF